MLLGAMPQALGESGTTPEIAEMIDMVISEMGLEEALDEGYTLFQLLAVLSEYEGECGTIRRDGNTLVYTIKGGAHEYRL